MDLDQIASSQATRVARDLTETAKRGGTEADFRREVAHILEAACAQAGLALVPRDEYTVARGRVDSVYNRLIVEYKRPGVLRESNDSAANRKVIEQVQGYILDVGKREKREAHRLAGVATDGFYYVFVRRVGEGWAVDDPTAVTEASTERFLRLLYSLSTGVALIPENLVQDFGPENYQAGQAVRALYVALHSSKNLLVKKLYEQWQIFFSEATDYKEWADHIESKPEFRKFVASLWPKDEIKRLTAGPVFFVLHTYYALLIKLVASLAAARFAGAGVADFAKLASKTGDQLLQACKDLEEGGLFKQYGIRNFLEGDFFGWYLFAWNAEIEKAVSSLLQRLKDYDPGALELAPENARDLLKKLYHYLLPREIRHDLGEYYTPDWLAEHTIRQTLGQAGLGNSDKRVLDPACGSGTFLVILIKHIRERAARKGHDPATTLNQILKNIIGFDLNPLAVIAARTNYLLALGDLLKARKGDIDIPVYQADSVLTPTKPHGAERTSQFGFAFEGDIYRLRTSVGEFDVPAFLADQNSMTLLTNVLDDCVHDGVTEKAFLKRLTNEVRLQQEELAEGEAVLAKLFRALRDLHDQGLNGVWARIIKNAFAPLFIGQCDYVVGNPPWVNWEHLPDEYRRYTMPLWEHYGLFPKRDQAMRTILGSAKYDIAMLMTYVAADRYLRHGGKLGFVVPQNLFKTSGAGQGFRRFMLPDRTPFSPMVVEDMVELNPFEGATNRTAVSVFAKGRAVTYPAHYIYWRKRTSGRGSAIGFDTPYDEVITHKITSLDWRAQPVNKNDKTSAWIAARGKAVDALQKVLGTSAYVGRAGTFTGGANAVYWLEVLGQRPGGHVMIANVTERAKKKVANTQAAIEQDLVYPLLRGADVSRWCAKPEINILLTHEHGQRLKAIPQDRMQADYPKTFSYLKRFEDMLGKRPALKRYFKEDAPFYSIFNIGDYTFSKHKVVWREVAHELDAAVVETGAVADEKKVVIPDHTCILVECASSQEAHFLCALVNSSPARLAIRNYIVLHPDPHVLTNINVPKFSAKDTIHTKLAELSKSAHKAATKSSADDVQELEKEIDRYAAKLWKLSADELKEIRESLEEL